jgi:hypothetical protein
MRAIPITASKAPRRASATNFTGGEEQKLWRGKLTHTGSALLGNRHVA